MRDLLAIFMLGAAIWGLIPGPHVLSTAQAQDSVKVFSLQRRDKESKQPPRELNDANVYGLSWRFKWAEIEPQEDQYDWQPIDTAMTTTKNSGKKVMLRIVAGVNSPDWLYNTGAKAFEFRNTHLSQPRYYRDSLRMLIPWDEAYLSKWEKFIRAFGQRYNGHPSIYSIQMTGGGYIGEMNLPKAYAQWRQMGYTDEKLIATWKRIIAAYQLAFPDTPTNLDINEPLGRRSNVLEPVVAYVLATYPRKVYLQNNGLRADFPHDNRIRRILREASSTTIVGYQMIGGKGWLDQQAGDRMSAFRNAIEDHASYVEVYAADVRDPAQQRALQFLATRSEEKRP
jgi:hypothetical protein